jgi:hypothetical protein
VISEDQAREGLCLRGSDKHHGFIEDDRQVGGAAINTSSKLRSSNACARNIGERA